LKNDGTSVAKSDANQMMRAASPGTWYRRVRPGFDDELFAAQLAQGAALTAGIWSGFCER
jgi:hypothetical protein